MILHRTRCFRASALVWPLLIAAFSGCMTWSMQGPSPEAAIRNLAPRTARVTRSDGSVVTVRNAVVTEGHLVAEPSPANPNGAASRVRIPITEVVSIATPRFSPGKTFALLLATGGAALLALGVFVAGDDE